MCVCVCVWVSICACVQSCLTLCGSMNCSPLSSSVHQILQGRILKWVASRLSQSRAWTPVSCESVVSCIGKQILYPYYHLGKYTNTHTHMYVYMYVCICICTYIHIYICIHVCICPFFYPFIFSADTYWFHILAIVNTAAIIQLYTYIFKNCFHFLQINKSGSLDFIVTLFWFYKEPPYCFLEWLHLCTFLSTV